MTSTFKRDIHAVRREKLRRLLKRRELDAILVHNVHNVHYLSGFCGDSSMMLLDAQGETLLSDSRFTTQIEEDCPGMDYAIRSNGQGIGKLIAGLLPKRARLAFESDSMTVALRDRLAGSLPRIEMLPVEGIVESLRQVKDSMEIAAIRRAIESAQAAFDWIAERFTPDQTERDLRNALEYQIRLFGAEDAAFPSIVAVGSRAALPHALPLSRQLGNDSLLLIDWGAKRDHYVCDMTRTLLPDQLYPKESSRIHAVSPKSSKRNTKKERLVYDTVRKAQEAAIAAMRPGASCESIDRIARNIIADAGFARRFTHSLGHGIGLEVHEWPRLIAGNQTLLAPGMVVTVEPGIYIPGWGGVRIEDDVLITKSGHEVLTRKC